MQSGGQGAMPAQVQQYASEMTSLLAKPLGGQNEAASAVDGIVSMIVGKSVMQGSPKAKLDAMIAALDQKLSKQVNEIMHSDRFRAAEGAWRGLHSMVFNSPTHEDVRIKMLNVGKDELNEIFTDYPGADFQNSPLFKKIYDPFDTPGASPFAAIVGDYYFGNGPVDMRVMKGMGAICHSAHAPFIAAADPQLLKLKSWNQINEPESLANALDAKGYEEFNTFRKSEDSRFVALTMPRTLARRPYGPDKEPVPGNAFVFHEEAGGGDSSKYVWQNASYAFGTRLIQSFADYGLGVNIQGREAGGAVTDLPIDTFLTDDGTLDTKCPTEVAITGRTEKDLSESCGLLPLCHYEGESFAVFFGSRNMHKAQVFRGDDSATANSRLGTSLPNMFAVTRFSHYLKKMVTDWGGLAMEEDKLRERLNTWVTSYVHPNPKDAPESELAKRPLAEAEVQVTPVPGQPGYYNAVFKLRPHFKLQGVDVSMRLVSTVGKK
jgi:type VI secretion system protein ImpC